MFEAVIMKYDFVKEGEPLIQKALYNHLVKKEGVFAPYRLVIFSVQQDPARSAYRVLYDIKEEE